MNCDVLKIMEFYVFIDVFVEMVYIGYSLSLKYIENIFEKLVDGNRKLIGVLRFEKG